MVRDPAAEVSPEPVPEPAREPAPAPVPGPTAGPALPALSGLSLEALRALLVGMGEPAYRATQVFSFLWRKSLWRDGVLDLEAMTTLPRALRARLAQATRPSTTTVLEVEESRDGTWKLLLGLRDGARVETVMIPEGDRRTVCVSTQVGCPIGCVFCASGVGGLLRNLDVAEIAEQVLVVRARLGARPSNVVVMGMGEPLLNLGALAAAVRIWQTPEGLDFGARRVTISTAGTAPMIDRLAAEDLGVHLAVSLHGPDDATRQRLVPGSPPGRVQDLVEAATRFARKTGRDVTVEYVLIEGENDGPEHAEALSRLVAGRHLHVNLIPLNPVTHRPDLRAPSGIAVTGFARRLTAAGVFVKPRSRRGDDIHAACGQLALERAVPPSPSPERRA